jgi:hypothetical protein
MRQLIFSVALALFLPNSLSAQPTGTSANQREVIAEGIGVDVQSAAQNAAFNAMTSVVGSFIDANKMLERKSEIEDGIRSESRRLTVNIREYSQGSIKAFEVLEAGQQGALFRVKAKVIVSTEEFQAFVRKLALADTVIGTELKTRMRVSSSQAGNAATILHDNILMPIASGEVIRIEIGDLVAVGEILKDPAQSKLVQRHGASAVAAARVRVTLDPQFVKNVNRTLSAVGVSGHLPKGQGKPPFPDGHIRLLVFGDHFTVRDAVPQMRSLSGVGAFAASPSITSDDAVYSSFGIELLDRGGVVMRRAVFKSENRYALGSSGLIGYQPSGGFEIIAKNGRGKEGKDRYPAAWSLVGYKYPGSGNKQDYSILIQESATLVVLTALEGDMLDHAAKLAVTIAK